MKILEIRKFIDNFPDSSIMVYIRIAPIRNRPLRLTSRWVVKCMSQRVVVIAMMWSPAHIAT
jgi:hypothetical protein